MRIFITGSTDGLGKLAATELLEQGHEVVIHARNEIRKRQILEELPMAEQVVIADLADMEETKQMAAELNAWGRFDTIIHNAGVYQTSKQTIFRVNCLAPYILTCLMDRPQRLIYISSGMHRSGSANLNQLSKGVTYSDSKLLLVMLTMAVARKWPDVYINAVNPGWVPTKMGGRNAPDNLQKGYETQVWLAVSDDPKVKTSGNYFFHKQQTDYNAIVNDVGMQEQLLVSMEDLSGIPFPD